MSGPRCVQVLCCLTCCHHGCFRCKDGEASAAGTAQAPACEDRKHFLFVPETSDSDGGSCDARAADQQDAGRAAGDKWLMAEVFEIISVDWQTWFGTLCVLLWLLYLIVI